MWGGDCNAVVRVVAVVVATIDVSVAIVRGLGTAVRIVWLAGVLFATSVHLWYVSVHWGCGCY